MPFWLEKAYSHPFWGVFGGKIRGSGKLVCSCNLSLSECNNLGLTYNGLNSVKSVSCLALGTEQNL